MWMQFICTRITPALNVSNVNTFRAILLFDIFKKKQIYIGQWIRQSMKHCVSVQKVRIFFPHLVTALYKAVEVPMEENEQFMHPTKSLIGDSMYTHHQETEAQQAEEGEESEEDGEEDEE
ncbi:hypothetical protein Gogos_018069 [Gossypium gossypioides]|uniref:Putative plant transposon protein domain-containing protein n=1 Tax=Gossypium gossypioides TaxID=34282 RepID=A0A7J9BET9_GOSGO|nr:hypothetical protein [Gossypium gossypioides]